MTTYAWNGQIFGTTTDWNTPANWLGGVVPDTPDADVVLPLITMTGTNQSVYYNVEVAAGETFSIGSLSLGSYLTVNGVLDVAGAVTYAGGEIDMGGGTLVLGSLDDTNGYDLQGFGTVESTNSIVNSGNIIGGGLTLAFGMFRDTGTLLADSGNVTLDVTGGAGDFANLVNGTLSGGIYGALGSSTLALDVGGPVVVDAASITISGIGSEIYTVANAGTTLLQSSLTTIAPSGTFSISASANYTTANSLTVEGTVDLGGTSQYNESVTGGTLGAASLLLAAGGLITGIGTVIGAISGAGTIAATGGQLTVGATGSAALQVASGTLELQAGAAGTMTFEDTDANVDHGSYLSFPSPELLLDDPTAFAGTIAGYNTLARTGIDVGLDGNRLIIIPDEIVLPGLSVSAVSNEAYTQSGQDGRLTFQVGTTTIALEFAGQYSLSDFALSAGPQPYSNSPPSIVISDPTIYLTGTAPTIDAAGTQGGTLSIYGTQSDASLQLGFAALTLTLLGTAETISAALSPYLPSSNSTANELILGTQGSSTITLGNGYQTVVAFGSDNTVKIGNAGSAPGILGTLSYINAGSGANTITVGNGTNVIDTGGYGDMITTGNGLNLVFASNLASAAASASLGPAGFTTLSLGTGNNFVYLHGALNVINENGGTDAVWGGTGGGDRFVPAASGGVLYVENFGSGDVIDLTKILAGLGIGSDPSSLGDVVHVVGTSADDQVFGVNDGGTKTVLQVNGASGTAYINLENVGSLTVAGLMAQNAFALPNS